MDRLDAKLRELTGYRMRRATFEVLATVTNALAPFGLRRPTFSALKVVVDTPGLRQSQVAKALLIERPNVVQLVDDLENAGLITRERVPEDRRVYALCPTDKGRDLCARAYAVLLEVEAAQTEGMTDEEVQIFYRFLEIIESNAMRKTKDDLKLQKS